MKLQVLVLVVALSVPSLALAQSGDDALRAEAAEAVQQIGWRYLAAKDGKLMTAEESPEACTQALAKLRRTSVKTIAHFKFKSLGGTPVKGSMLFELSIPRAEWFCSAYAKFYKFREHLQLFSELRSSVELMKPSMSPSPDFVKNTLAKVKQCQAAADEILAMDIPASFAFQVGEASFTVGNIRAQICDNVPGAAAKYTADQAAAKREKEAPYIKAGLKGDRLDLLVTYGAGVRMPGGAVSKDWKKYVTPAALFVVLNELTPDSTGHIVYTVHKYEFKKDKRVKSTTQTYRLRPADALTAKHFR